ncbi:MAG: lipopolysaccharide biosynthesis protein [Solirubrobacterales bacterium]
MTANGETAQPELDGDQLRDAAVSGVRWFAIARVATEALQLVSAVALARLVSPAEFGNASVALILIPLAVILTYEGFGSALVQRKLIETGHFEAATLTSLATGLGLSLLVYFLAPVVAAPIFSDEIAHLIQVAAPAFALAGLGAVSRARLSRNLDFRPISIIETGALAVGAGVAIGLAALGLGGEAVVIGAVAGIGFTSLAMAAVSPPGRPRWRRKELVEVSRFGAPASAAGLLYVAISNVDYAVLAARLNPAQVGIYWRAFQIGVLYQDKISGIMMRLAFPIYSRTNNLDEMKKLHERATRIHGAVVVPLLAILIVTAPELIPMVFGDAWRAAIEPTQVLAVAGMVAAILTGYSQVMLAAGRPRALLTFNCVVLVAYGLAVFLTARQGLVTVSLAVVGVHVAMLAAVYLVLFRRVLGMPVGRLFTDLAPAAATAALVLAAGLPVADLLRGAGAAPVFIVLAAGLAGCLVQALALRAFFPEVWRDVSRLLRRLLPDRLAKSSATPQPLTP